MPPRQCPRQARGAWCGPRKRRTGKPIDASVRQDILLYFAQGFSVTKTLELMRKDSVKRHGVLLFYRGPSLRTIERCRAQFKRFRRATPADRLERVPTFTYVQGAAIMEWVNCQSDGYSLQDVISWFHFTFPHRVVGSNTMCRWLQYMGFTRKKRTNTAAQILPRCGAARTPIPTASLSGSLMELHLHRTTLEKSCIETVFLVSMDLKIRITILPLHPQDT